MTCQGLWYLSDTFYGMDDSNLANVDVMTDVSHPGTTFTRYTAAPTTSSRSKCVSISLMTTSTFLIDFSVAGHPGRRESLTAKQDVKARSRKKSIC